LGEHLESSTHETDQETDYKTFEEPRARASLGIGKGLYVFEGEGHLSLVLERLPEVVHIVKHL